MTRRCPYCGGELNGELALPPMSIRQKVIYDAVVNSGGSYVTTEAIKEKVYGETEPPKGADIVMRVQIHGLNRILAPLNMRVRGYRGRGYKLVSADASS